MDGELLVGDLMDGRFEACEAGILVWQLGAARAPGSARVIPLVASFETMELVAELHAQTVNRALEEQGDAALDLRVLDLGAAPAGCETSETSGSALAIMRAAGRSRLPVTASGRLVGTLRFEVAYRFSFSDSIAREANGIQALHLS